MPKPQLDERSAAYLSDPDPKRVPLDLSETLRARVAHLEGMVTALAAEVDELKRRAEEKEGDGK